MSQQPLWAPWRMEFLTGDKGQAPAECVFCALPRQSEDRQNLIVHRGEKAFVILNKYPYNNGHLMVVPFRHVADLRLLPDDELGEMNRLAKTAIGALDAAYKPQGFNMGMNLGLAAGAGIKDHLHLHIVPRWIGDTNFMPVLAETKSMPQHLLASYDQIHACFPGRERG